MRQIGCVFLFVLLLPLCGTSTPRDERALALTADSTCEEIFDRFAQALREAGMVEIEVTLHEQIVEADRAFSLPPLYYRMLLGDGARLRIEPVFVRKDDALHQRLQAVSAVSDGDELLLLDARHQRYTTQHAPETWRAIVGDLGGSPLYALQRLASHFILAIPDSNVVEVEQPTDGDRTEQDGRVFQSCRFRVIGENQGADSPDPESEDHFFIWFEDGDPPVPRRLETRFGLLRTHADRRFEGVLVFDEWRYLPEIDPERFATDKPDDAILVSSHFQLLLPMVPEPAPRPEAMLNKPAPDVRLVNPRGRSIPLDELRQDRVIVLGFWATWSPPSVQSLPDLMAIEREFADRGVALYAINMRQTPQRIGAFLKEQDWSGLKVAFDRDGEAAARYEVNAIPHAVIIDREGIVRHVHVGYSPDLRERFRNALETILADEANRGRED